MAKRSVRAGRVSSGEEAARGCGKRRLIVKALRTSS